MEGGKVSSSNRAGRRASRSSTPQGSSPMSSASAAAAASAAASSTSSSRSQVASKRRHASLSPKSRQPSAAGAVPADKPAGPTANGLSAAPSSLALAAPKRRGAGNKGGSSSCMGACLRLVSVTFILVFFTLLTSVDLIAKGLVLRQRRGSDGTFSGFSRSLLTGADLPGGASDWAGTASNGSSSAGSQRGQDGGEGSAELEEQLRQSDVRQAEGESEGETGGSERSEGIGGGVGGASGLQLPKLEQQWEEKRVRSWFGESGGGSTGDGGAGEQSQSVDALLEERVDAALSAVQERHKALNSQPFQLHILVYGECNITALTALLESLRSVQYGDDKVHITVAASCNDAVHVVHAFQWFHGTKRAVNLGASANSTESHLWPLQLWQPQSASEFLFVLHVHSRVSRAFYHVVKDTTLAAARAYGTQHAAGAQGTAGSGSGSGSQGEEGAERGSAADDSGDSEGGESGSARRLLGVTDGGSGASGSAGETPRGPVSLFGIGLDPQSPVVGAESPVFVGARPPPPVLSTKEGTPGAEEQGSAPGSLPSLLASTLFTSCQLVMPGPWQLFWRWHEAMQGPQLDSADLAYDWDAYDFSQPCRADWQLSLLTFMEETNRLNLVMLPLKDGSQLCQSLLSAEPGLQRAGVARIPVPLTTLSVSEKLSPRHLLPASGPLEGLPRFDHCGRVVPGGAVAMDTEELKPLLQRLNRQMAVVGVMVSPGYDDMLNNWLCYVKELQIHNYFIITQDRQHALRLAKRGLAVYCAGCREREKAQQRSGQGTQEAQPLNYGSTEYKEFILARTKAVGDILKAGYNVLLADVDAAWLADPFAFLKADSVDILAQLEERGNPCGGFLLLVHTRRLIVLWDLLTAMFEEHIQWTKTHPSRRDPAEYAKFLEKQKHSHEQKFLLDLLKQKRQNVKLQGLDPLLFINGRDYWDRRKAQKARVVPVMIHNNYVVSKHNKTRRFRIKGMWRVDTAGDACKCLAVTCTRPQDPWFLADVNGTGLAAHSGTVHTLAQFLHSMAAQPQGGAKGGAGGEEGADQTDAGPKKGRKGVRGPLRRRHGGVLQLAQETRAIVGKLVLGRGRGRGKASKEKPKAEGASQGEGAAQDLASAVDAALASVLGAPVKKQAAGARGKATQARGGAVEGQGGAGGAEDSAGGKAGSGAHSKPAAKGKQGRSPNKGAQTQGHGEGGESFAGAPLNESTGSPAGGGGAGEAPKKGGGARGRQGSQAAHSGGAASKSSKDDSGHKANADGKGSAGGKAKAEGKVSGSAKKALRAPVVDQAEGVPEAVSQKAASGSKSTAGKRTGLEGGEGTDLEHTEAASSLPQRHGGKSLGKGRATAKGKRSGTDKETAEVKAAGGSGDKAAEVSSPAVSAAGEKKAKKRVEASKAAEGTALDAAESAGESSAPGSSGGRKSQKVTPAKVKAGKRTADSSTGQGNADKGQEKPAGNGPSKSPLPKGGKATKKAKAGSPEGKPAKKAKGGKKKALDD